MLTSKPEKHHTKKKIKLKTDLSYEYRLLNELIVEIYVPDLH